MPSTRVRKAPAIFDPAVDGANDMTRQGKTSAALGKKRPKKAPVKKTVVKKTAKKKPAKKKTTAKKKSAAKKKTTKK